MAKVIVERPRLGGGLRRPKGLRKRERLALVDQMPAREGYRRRWTSGTKDLNEHLAPLRRFLQSQVGRPWNKIHSEISRHLRLDSAVQSHVLDHLRDYVETNARLVDGVVCNAVGESLAARRWCRALFYVCPRSGLLKTARRDARPRSVAAPPTYLVISDSCQWHCRGGIWYEIELTPLEAAPPNARDALLKTALRRLAPGELRATYGCRSYATSKRQLGKRQVRMAQRRLNEAARKARAH